MDEQKGNLINQLDNARAKLKSVLARVEPDMDIYPSWHLKELTDHIAGWDDAVVAAIRSHAQGDVPAVTAPLGINHYNAQTVTTREAIPLEHSLREFDVTREQLKQVIREMPIEKFRQSFVSPWGDTITVEQLVEIFVHHELTHAEEIEQALHQAS
jgi:hypothetical protein